MIKQDLMKQLEGAREEVNSAREEVNSAKKRLKSAEDKFDKIEKKIADIKLANFDKFLVFKDGHKEEIHYINEDTFSEDFMEFSTNSGIYIFGVFPDYYNTIRRGRSFYKVQSTYNLCRRDVDTLYADASYIDHVEFNKKFE